MSLSKRVLAVAGVASLLFAACGGGAGPEPSSVHQRPAKGYTVTMPDGWHRAEHNLTPHVTDPVEALSLATSAFRTDDRICHALKRIVPSGAFLTLQERGAGVNDSPEFPARPARFRPKQADEGYSTWPLCGVRDGEPPIPMDHYWFNFRDAGRAFHVLVAFGKEAPNGVRADAFAALGSLRLDPDARPDWASTAAYVHRDGQLGFAATIPAGWWRADEPVDDQTTNPRELLILSTFEVPDRARASDGCGPFYDHVLDRMPSDGALLALRERLRVDGPSEFPPRPKAFELGPTDPEPGGCGPAAQGSFRRWWIPFEHGGRYFYAQVDMGLDAPRALREAAESVLNSFGGTAG
jgi:hypothetical protein